MNIQLCQWWYYVILYSDSRVTVFNKDFLHILVIAQFAVQAATAMTFIFYLGICEEDRVNA